MRVPEAAQTPRKFYEEVYENIHAHEIRIPHEIPSAEISAQGFEDLLSYAQYDNLCVCAGQ
jgi:hypothetical protein